MPDELDELFPNLAPYLRDNVSPSENKEIPGVGVSMEDVDRYMQGKVNPMFRSGVGAPPPVGGWEDGTTNKNDLTPGRVVAETNPAQPPSEEPHQDAGDNEVPSTPPNTTTDPTQAPTPTPAESPQPFQTGEEEAPSDTPNETQSSQTTPSPTTPPDGNEFVQLGDVRIPRSRVEAYLALDQELQNDPELRQKLADHFQAKNGVAAPTTATTPTPTPTPTPTDPFASIPEEYRDDPLVQSMRSMYETQQAEIARLNAMVTANYEDLATQRQLEYQKAAETGLANFQRAHDLTDDDMANLRQAAAKLNVVDSYLPTLGPVGAVEKALEVAYFADENFRAKEVQRVATQQRQDSAKKQKLAAISGSSGSVPRTNPAPTTPEGNRAAMIDAVGQMMNGTWTGDNN